MSKMYVSRFVTLVAGLACGAYAVAAAFRNGFAQASTDVDGYIIGIAFAAVVVGSWPLLGLADNAKAHGQTSKAWGLRLGWAICLVFIVVNAVGYINKHRTENVGSRVETAAAYDRASAQLAAAMSSLEDMKKNRRWDSTSACTDATVPQSIAFCEEVEKKRIEIKQARTTLAKGKPAVADPHASQIAWILQADIAIVTKALPTFLGVVLEIMASLLFYASAGTAHNKVKRPVIDVGTITEIVDAEEPKQTKALDKPKAKKKQKRTQKSEPAHVGWKIDGRNLRGVKNRIANENDPN